jgi:VIT1/CCC1 family predicted Fe2+/Mn2+ transporter
MVIHREYLRSIIFGVEDSLVSTTGLLAGISITAQNSHYIITTGLIAILIEAVSMGVSEYLSDDAVKDIDKMKRNTDSAFLSGLFLMIAYIIAGLIPLTPIAFLRFPISLVTSVILALVGLFLLGYIKGALVHSSRSRGAIKILIVGGITTILGLILGYIFKI